MKESVLDVLMFLFEHYVNDDNIEPARDQLEIKLLDVGFPAAEIDRAFEWLDGLNTQENISSSTGRHTPLRIYTESECARLDRNSRGFLLFLEQERILDPSNRELVIDRVIALDEEEITLDQVKWVILMVLFNQPDQELGYEDLEDLVFEEIPHLLH